MPLTGARPADFCRTHRLRREIAFALALKAVALAALYLMFFSAGHRPPADAAATGAAVIEPRAAGESR